MNQIDSSKYKKKLKKIPGRIIRPGGADNPAPRKFLLQLAAVNNLIDRGKDSYNMIHNRGKQQLEDNITKNMQG
jgi:hypothetical protein